MTDALAHVEIARTARVLAEAPVDPADWLSDSERARFAELRHDGRRAHYLAGHWLVRVLLARAHDREPAQWRLAERRSLPPQVEGDVEPTWISIAHSADWIAAAVAPIPIGIDLESRPRTLAPAVESLLLNAGEPPGSVGSDALLQRWVAKEAWIKREAGAALPARLAQLQLAPIDPELADLRLYGHAAFHLAVALAPGCAQRWQGEAALIPGAAFAVYDLADLDIGA